MKKIILFLLILISAKCFSQTDSNTVFISPVIQNRDIEFISVLTAYSGTFENWFDTTKIKYRAPNTAPTGNTNVTVKATIGEWVAIDLALRSSNVALVNSCFSRVDAAIRLLNVPFVNNILNTYDAIDQANFVSQRAVGRKNLRKQ
jgi:hypothetical protein